MFFSRQLPLWSLTEFCRVLRHNLEAGLTLRHVFRQQAERGPRPVRPVAERISRDLEQGESLKDALTKEEAHFPVIFVSLTAVGEESGNLPEVLADLEKYFVLQQRLRRQFFSQIAWPVIQMVAAIFVIAGMIYVLALLSTGQPFDPLGLGYTGTSGALRFLIHAFGFWAILIGLYLVLTRSLKQKAVVDELLLRLPVIGPCLRAIALMRFCLSLRLTMESAMPIVNSLRLSMRATGNAAFETRIDVVCEAVKGGEDLTEALRRAGLFPEDFLNIMANAEEAGRVPEVMRHQADYYEEESRRRMTILTQAASWGVYAAVAGLIIFMIFRIALTYIGMLDPGRYGL
jgi:type II secretory pathway component PulF